MRSTANARLPPQVFEQGSDYALALKGNQGKLHDVAVRFLDDPRSTLATSRLDLDVGHDRMGMRTASVGTDVARLQNGHRWPGLQAFGKVYGTRETAAVRTAEIAYYLLSTPLPRSASTKSSATIER